MILFLIFLSVWIVNAQETSLSGKVTSSDGKPLPGVTVVVKGTSTGTITNSDGHFTLKSTIGSKTLVFSFIGMKSKEVPITSSTIYNAILEEDTYNLDEVVAIGYGTMKKRDLTGSVSSVKGDNINAFPTDNVLQALNGRSSGVQVNQNTGSPGGSVSVRIRGTNSIMGSNEPLYVIDGFPGNLSVLNNSDIESIEILKDASATAIYGSRGANGVVLITTKQGKAGKTKVEYESSYGLQQLSKKLDLMNAKEYTSFYNKLADIKGNAHYFTQSDINTFGEGTDWEDAVFKTAPIQSHSLNISGGTEKTQFLIASNVFDQEGIIKGSDYQKYSVLANISHNINEKLSVKYGVILSRIIRNSKDDSGVGSMIHAILYAPPIFIPHNADGTITQFQGKYGLISDLYNPFNQIDNASVSNKSNSVNANVGFSYKLTPDLIIRVKGSINNNDGRSDSYINNSYVGTSPRGSASVSTAQSLSLINENTITYTRNFNNNHSFQALAGITYEESKYTSLSASGSGFLSDIFETYNLSAATTFGTPSTAYSKSALLSYLGRINYSFKDRYLFTASMRADGSSKYSEGDKWGYFPSAAVAWKIKQENFLKDNPIISDLKLRISYGNTGSQAINAYATQVLLGSDKAVFNNSYYTSFAPGTVYPGNLKWETTEQEGIGVDAGIFKNRIRLTADYYYKKTTNLLNNVQFPSSMGWTSSIKNIGSIQNKGLELAIDANILNGGFKWDVSGNIAFNQNKVLKLNNGQNIPGSTFDITLLKDYINIISEGHPLGVFYGYLENGYDDKGMIKYKDLNNDGIINSLDKKIIGDPNPKFIYGLNSTMSYRNFELSLFFQGSYGNDIFNLSSARSTLSYGYGFNLLRNVYYDGWTPESTHAKYPIINNGNSANISDRFVEDGSYLRLRNVKLCYNFQGQKHGVNWISNIQLYISAENLITFTKYSWWDPDVNSFGSGASVNQGIDLYTYPSAKSVSLGLKIRF